VFLKGWPLRCIWCHNPEGLSSEPQLAYYAHKCVGCGECAAVCPRGAHELEDGTHIFHREKCVACGICRDNCPAAALTLYGMEMTVEELLPKLLEDKDFYESSGGGVTLSGGECLVHYDFCRELLKRLKEEGISTAVDTCGMVSREAIDAVIPYTDVFLYDIKAIDESVHIRCTERPNAKIIENIRYISQRGASVEVRIPYVPEYNDGEIEKITRLLSEIKTLVKVRVLPYHNYAGSKYEALGMENNLPERIPTSEEITAAKELIRGFGIRVTE
jgi:pyruvate formate lyase activating enzyme